MIDFTFKIGGEAGFGIATSGLVFSKVAARLGYHIFDYLEYPSLIRGGHNAFECRVADFPVSFLRPEIDLLICLNKETFDKHQFRLTKNSFVIYDNEEFEIEGDFIGIKIPFEKIVSQLKGQTVMKNTIALGASLAILGGKIDSLEKIIEEQFKKKGEKVINFNKQFAQAGYDLVIKNYSHLVRSFLGQKESGQKLVISGNDAFSLASVIADCRLYCAYPMTPSSSVLATLAAWQEKVGIIVRHPEDEISVIHTALGASFAGVRAAVGTSGGGFALMTEAISFAGIAEIPIVIFLAQRPGPATGMPTWTEQGDLLFAVHSGHGEFPKIVLAPGDQEEMLSLTLKAYNLADIYQTPVIVLSDMFLSESHKSVEKEFVDNLVRSYRLERGKIIDRGQITNFQDQRYLRYQITEDGISARMLPGIPGYFYQANSYEHLEDGHTTEESQPRKEQVEKRRRKIITYLKNHFQPASIYGEIEKSQIIFVSWGSTKGAILETQKILADKGILTTFIHFTHLYPLAKEIIAPLFITGKRYILVENNSFGQFGKLLLQETGVEIKEKILKYDGRPIWPKDIISYVNSH